MINMMDMLATTQFRQALAQIIGINIILSGDNAVVVLVGKAMGRVKAKPEAVSVEN